LRHSDGSIQRTVTELLREVQNARSDVLKADEQTIARAKPSISLRF
jgi:hypothetical protein